MSATQLANASQMGEPVNPWMMETGSFCIWGALLLLTLTPCSRSMASTRPAIAGTNGRSSMRLCVGSR